MLRRLLIIFFLTLSLLGLLFITANKVEGRIIDCDGNASEDGCCTTSGDPDCDPNQVGGTVLCTSSLCGNLSNESFCCQGSNVCGGIPNTNCVNVQPWTYCYDPTCTRTGRDKCAWQTSFETCSAGDTCISGQPYLYPGLCSSGGCTTGSQKYKTCCTDANGDQVSDGTVDGRNCQGGEFSGSCRSGAVSVRCGDSGLPACGAAACASGFPGVPAYTEDTNLTTATVSEKGWLAKSPYQGRKYDYEWFKT